jgi:O-antigen chain-terminating methyltransferase
VKTKDDARPDVAAILADLREQIRERRARLTTGEKGGPGDLNLAELRRSVDAVNDTWFVSAHLPITWEKRIVGRLNAYTKRLVRLLLRWYINPIVEQQIRFNSAVARTTVEMLAYQERMAREWQELEQRVAKLEEVLSGEENVKRKT